MRRCAFPIILSLVAGSGLLQAAPSDPAPTEDRLRARVAEFYQDMVDHKFRQGEELVAEQDRDAYYAMAKPQLKDYKIVSVSIDNNDATVKVQSDQFIYPPRILKPMIMPLAGVSHWHFENGDWWWTIPAEQTMQTPFGPVTVRKDMNPQVSSQQSLDMHPADPNQLSVHQKVLQGATVEHLWQGVKADVTSLHIADAVGSTGTVTLENTLSGIVRIGLRQDKESAFRASLATDSLGAGKKATLTITRQKKGAPGTERLYVFILPTQQTIEIAIE